MYIGKMVGGKKKGKKQRDHAPTATMMEEFGSELKTKRGFLIIAFIRPTAYYPRAVKYLLGELLRSNEKISCE